MDFVTFPARVLQNVLRRTVRRFGFNAKVKQAGFLPIYGYDEEKASHILYIIGQSVNTVVR